MHWLTHQLMMLLQLTSPPVPTRMVTPPMVTHEMVTVQALPPKLPVDSRHCASECEARVLVHLSDETDLDHDHLFEPVHDRLSDPAPDHRLVQPFDEAADYVADHLAAVHDPDQFLADEQLAAQAAADQHPVVLRADHQAVDHLPLVVDDSADNVSPLADPVVHATKSKTTHTTQKAINSMIS